MESVGEIIHFNNSDVIRNDAIYDARKQFEGWGWNIGGRLSQNLLRTPNFLLDGSRPNRGESRSSAVGIDSFTLTSDWFHVTDSPLLFLLLIAIIWQSKSVFLNSTKIINKIK